MIETVGRGVVEYPLATSSPIIERISTVVDYQLMSL